MKHAHAHYNITNGHGVFAIAEFTLPCICSRCLVPTQNRVTIRGNKRDPLSLLVLFALYHAHEMTVSVYFCEDCVRRHERRIWRALAWGVISVLCGWYLLANLNNNNLLILAAGFFLLVLAPLLIAFLTSRSGRKPILYDFDERFVEIDFRNIEYVNYLQEHWSKPAAQSEWPDATRSPS